MGNLLRDLRFSLKQMLKDRGFTVVAVLTLALGIGVNSAVFSVVNAVLLRALPYKDSGQLVMLWESNPQKGLDKFPTSYPNFKDYQDQGQVFQAIAAFRSNDFNLTGMNEPERIAGAEVSPEFFPMLGVSTQVGHTFSPEESKPGSNVVIISQGLWQRRFGARPDIVGQVLTLNDKGYTVAGVMPESFRFPGELFDHVDLWTPLNVEPEEAGARTLHTLFMVARLKPQVSAAQAQSEVRTIASRLQQQYRDSNGGWNAKLVPLQEEFVGDFRTSLWVLLGAVSFVLLIACVNVANLLLARAMARQKEIAVRMAVGAKRRRMIQQLLTESLSLSLVGGGLGLLFASLGVSLLQNIIPADYTSIQSIGLDKRVLGYTMLISVATAVIFGLVPALQATKLNISEWLKEGSGKSSSGVRRRYFRNLLVVSEIAISLLLFIGASLLVKSFIQLQQVDPGFTAENVLTLEVTLPDAKYDEEPKQRAFFEQALQQLRDSPAIKSAGAITDLPLGGKSKARGFLIEGHPVASPSEQPTASYSIISPDYFATMGIPLVKGRYFTERDTDKSPMAAIINETLARRYFPNDDPIGKHVILKKAGQPVSREIVGVVKDVKNSSLEAEAAAGLFTSYLQEPSPAMTLVLRGNSNPQSLVPIARNVIRTLDPYLPVDNVSTLEQVVARSLSHQRLNVILLGIFAAVALILAAVGIYSLMAHGVRQRTREIGIRLALGARSYQILKMVVGQGLRLTALGIVIGVVAALFLTRLINSMLYGVSAIDPLVFAGSPLLLAFVALVATYLPARKATRVDPMIAMRNE